MASFSVCFSIPSIMKVQQWAYGIKRRISDLCHMTAELASQLASYFGWFTITGLLHNDAVCKFHVIRQGCGYSKQQRPKSRECTRLQNEIGRSETTINCKLEPPVDELE
jgi:hypothetical protein